MGSAIQATQVVSSTEMAAIRAQLRRLVAHELFAHSKRYPTLLSYTVEQTLAGHGAELKERTIGIEAFGRPADYDANADPVVRITAAEVRKRLIQYYYDPAHAGEPVIELPVGAYVPVFHLQEKKDLDGAAGVPVEEARERAALESFRLRRRWPLWVAAVLAAFALGFAVAKIPSRPQPTPVARFWSHFTESAAPITFCLGDPSEAANPNAPPQAETQALQLRLHQSGHLDVADVVTLARAMAPLQMHQRAFRLLTSGEASFTQLREGPIVLIGAFDNVWTLRLTEHLRFGFDSRDGVGRVVDRKNPKSTAWSTSWSIPYQQLTHDYGIVARFHDAVTGQPVILIAGISDAATEAASEVLYNPAYLDAMLQKAPRDWESRNMEVVIETHLIEGHAGPPQVLAVESW